MGGGDDRHGTSSRRATGSTAWIGASTSVGVAADVTTGVKSAAPRQPGARPGAPAVASGRSLRLLGGPPRAVRSRRDRMRRLVRRRGHRRARAGHRAPAAPAGREPHRRRPVAPGHRPRRGRLHRLGRPRRGRRRAQAVPHPRRRPRGGRSRAPRPVAVRDHPTRRDHRPLPRRRRRRCAAVGPVGDPAGRSPPMGEVRLEIPARAEYLGPGPPGGGRRRRGRADVPRRAHRRPAHRGVGGHDQRHRGPRRSRPRRAHRDPLQPRRRSDRGRGPRPGEPASRPDDLDGHARAPRTRPGSQHEHGLGLPLMRVLADEAEIRSGEGGTAVRLVVYRAASAPEPAASTGEPVDEPQAG